MKKNFFIILSILLIATFIAIYTVYNYRIQAQEAQKINKEYEQYKDINLLGTQLISLINRTIDYNEKNEIQKDENNKFYIENEENSIKIYINFIYKEETKTILMESIASNGSEAFVSNYSTAKFKCTNIEYHEKTKSVKSLTFEEIQ